MKIRKLAKMSLISIWSNKMRSFLTMLGIIIGISSVIVLVGAGEGTSQQISAQIEKLGTNLITINITGNRVKALTNEELEELKTKPGIKDIAPTFSQGGISVKAEEKTYSTNVEATTPNYSSIRKTYTSNGRFIVNRDIENRNKVAVIGTVVAQELFGTTNVVGKSINISNMDFQIVGVLEEQGSTAAGSADDKIILPLSTAQRLLRNTTVKMFYVEAENKDKVDEAMGYLQLFLNKKFNNEPNSYRVFNQTSLLQTANDTSRTLTMMLTGIAAISLMVGGIGIMNIMLVSVIERTKEIGIRKAIGAKRRTIMLQFLMEASALSGLGGILGVIAGFMGGYVLQSAFKLPVVITGQVVLIAFGFSIAVGIIFGIYPASKASKLSPIDALRFE